MTSRTDLPSAGSQSHAVLALSDVADLAWVRRPVPSVWRRRYAGSAAPFPAPVRADGSQEYFDVSEVVAWLEGTGRGNNPSVRADAALAVALDAVPQARRSDVALGLTALLCLKARAGISLESLPPDALLDLAESWDPDDIVLLREVEALGEELPSWAVRVDAIASAGYSARSALERLVAREQTTSMDGRQSESWDDVTVSWSYHPDRGLDGVLTVEEP